MKLLERALTPLAGRGHSSGTQLLEVRDLEVRTSANLALICGVSFHIAAGEVVGLFGESGSGKTTLAMALLRLLPKSFRITGGSVQFESRSLLCLSERELRKTRGARISLIHADLTVLNPVMRVGDQIVEVLRAHRDWNKHHCREEARQLLTEVDIEDVDRVYTSYPHQLSGGQRQRVVIAQALACRPALVIADEPTSSLDPATASSIVELIRRLNRQLGIAFLLISHDIKILAELADRVMVMYAGKLVEQGRCQTIVNDPLHPYSRALLSCVLPERTAAYRAVAKSPLSTIEGIEMEQYQSSPHCSFEGRCADRMPICAANAPKEVFVGNAHTVSCFKFGNA